MHKKNKEIIRKYLRYQRRDIAVRVKVASGRSRSVEVLNISQYGIAFKSKCNLKVNNILSLSITFPEGGRFEEQCRIVNRTEVAGEKRQGTEQKKGFWKWLCMQDDCEHDYSAEFCNASPKFQAGLLASNIHRRFEHYDEKQ